MALGPKSAVNENISGPIGMSEPEYKASSYSVIVPVCFLFSILTIKRGTFGKKGNGCGQAVMGTINFTN